MSSSGIIFCLLRPSGAAVELDATKEYHIGRDLAADIVLDDHTASRRHCRMYWHPDGAWVLEDLGSANGTIVNEKSTSGPVMLVDGDKIQAGNSRLIYAVLPANTDPEKARSLILSRAYSQETLALPSLDKATGMLPVLSGDVSETSFKELLLYLVVASKSGLLRFGDDGAIWFENGAPRHAQAAGIAGIAAIRLLAGRKLSRYEFLEGGINPPAPNIHGETANVLFSIFGPEDQLRMATEDLDRAENLQQHMLERLPSIPGYDIGVYFKGFSRVSGDFYDVGEMADGRILIVLGDVSGHGVQAAIVVASLIKTLRLLRQIHDDVRALISALNEEVRQDLLTSQFCTLFAAALQPATGKMEVVLAGHNPALLLAEGKVRKVGDSGRALGLFKHVDFSQKIVSTRFTMPAGAVLLQYSDGLTEARNAAGEEFGEVRLANAFATIGGKLPINQLAATLVDRCHEFATVIEDDLTILALRRQ
jgi:pSer/pThr/pTyr-binding forkhead associated (FHA) protein